MEDKERLGHWRLKKVALEDKKDGALEDKEGFGH